MLVERYAQPQPIPKGQNLTQRTMEHFHFWGAEDAAARGAHDPARLRHRRPDRLRHAAGRYSYDWLQRELVRPYYFTDNERLPQYATEAVLRRRAAELPSVETLYGWSAVDLRRTPTACTSTIAERDGDGRRTLRGATWSAATAAARRCASRPASRRPCTDHDRLMVLLVFRSHGLHELLERYPGKSFYNVLQPDAGGLLEILRPRRPGHARGSSTRRCRRAPRRTTSTSPATCTRPSARNSTSTSSTSASGTCASPSPTVPRRPRLHRRRRRPQPSALWRLRHQHRPRGCAQPRLEARRRAAGLGRRRLLDSYDAERRPVFASTARDFIAKSIETDRPFLANLRSRDATGRRSKREWQARAQGAARGQRLRAATTKARRSSSGPPGGDRSAVGSHRFEARAGHHLAPRARVRPQRLRGAGHRLHAARPWRAGCGYSCNHARRWGQRRAAQADQGRSARKPGNSTRQR